MSIPKNLRRLAQISFLILIGSTIIISAEEIGERGHVYCPCLENLDDFPIDPADLSADATAKLGVALFSNTYGVGCKQHDTDTPQCKSSDCAQLVNVVPAPLRCDLSWCQRRWCFVDPNKCDLMHRRSPNYPESDRFYSYATCGDADAFTRNNRFAALEGKVLKVGLNSNSGGWLGAYSSDGVHFEGPRSKWSGPLLDFLRESALRGNFSYNITEPPKELRPKADSFFDGASAFDYCVYATSLGYLDLCISQYTITDQRSSTTDWLLLGSEGLYLVAVNSAIDASPWESFMGSVGTIFQPFTVRTWIFIVFFVIPILGCLMIVHEQGKSGSTYPRHEVVVYTYEDGRKEVKKRVIPFWRTLLKSFYISLLALLQQSYEQSVISVGAMLNLLGISFFILTIIAVYTANLAAILTQQAERADVTSLADAISRGYRICAERKNMESITNVYPNIDVRNFALDPMFLGGDGKPGFNCPNCKSRTRVFDMMDPRKAEYDDRYCHAAVAPMEDLDVLQSEAKHCNKTIVGTPIQFTQTGIPIFEQISPQLSSFFLKLKTDGLYDTTVLASKPQPKCAAIYEGGEGSALTLDQLSGIWVISFGFAFVGLLVTFGQKYYMKKIDKSNYRVQYVHKRDQRGSRIETLGSEDAYISSRLQVFPEAEKIDPNKAGMNGGSTTSKEDFGIVEHEASDSPNGDKENDNEELYGFDFGSSPKENFDNTTGERFRTVATV